MLTSVALSDSHQQAFSLSSLSSSSHTSTFHFGKPISLHGIPCALSLARWEESDIIAETRRGDSAEIGADEDSLDTVDAVGTLRVAGGLAGCADGEDVG